MLGFATRVRLVPHLALIAALSSPLALLAAPVVVQLQNYVASNGTRANYFTGKLLTQDDLGNDQEYKRGTDRYLGETELSLDDLFVGVGRVNIFLTFDDIFTSGDAREDPFNTEDPHHEDMVFLDLGEGTWRGRLYLEGVGDVRTGSYNNLVGTFDRFVAIDEPASGALAALAVAGLCAARRRRMPTARGVVVRVRAS